MLRTNAFVGKTVTTEMTSQCLNMQKDRVSSPRQDLSLHGLVSVPSRTMAYQVRAKSITRTQLKQGKNSTIRSGSPLARMSSTCSLLCVFGGTFKRLQTNRS